MHVQWEKNHQLFALLNNVKITVGERRLFGNKHELRTVVTRIIQFLCSAKLQIYSLQGSARLGKHSWPILTRNQFWHRDVINLSDKQNGFPQQ
jgi:hypothetical protein